MINLTDKDRKQYIEVLLALGGHNSNRKDDEALKNLPKNLTNKPPKPLFMRGLGMSK